MGVRGGDFWEPAGSPRPLEIPEKGVPGARAMVGWARPGGCPLSPTC